ncbi:hypothetical protein AZE42_11200 [Rhizopogon vesiculosus]|uniref:F-box domain-containing protein n=1 Tax=Rhizopogon vesiculosus TaxID=180088 RepID=A0A1J8PNW6_9AGAM|nr:hypothetical protein AZE42_11200 [Rhizopogon vesiculosus]
MPHKVMDEIKIGDQQLLEQQDGASAGSDLPVEVLCQIFDHCVPKTDEGLPPDLKRAPILLTRICRQWREVVVDMPSLWCRLYLQAECPEQLHRVAFSYRSWLKRSFGRPLSLTIHWSPKGAVKLQNLLQPFTIQISSLMVISLVEESFAPALSFEDFPSLQDLTLSWLGSCANETALAQSLSRLPSTLRSLKLRGLLFQPLKWLSTCNVWAQLTHVEIIRYTWISEVHTCELGSESRIQISDLCRSFFGAKITDCVT